MGLDKLAPGVYFPRTMARETFREWLESALTASGATKRGVARRMAEKHPRGATTETIESHRRTLNKILGGTQNPTQPTRDAIQDALDRHDAPTVDEEASDAPTAHEAIAELREIRKSTFRLERALGVRP